MADKDSKAEKLKTAADKQGVPAVPDTELPEDPSEAKKQLREQKNQLKKDEKARKKEARLRAKSISKQEARRGSGWNISRTCDSADHTDLACDNLPFDKA